MKYAEYFASGGFAVLAYDNINFGASGGEPRQEVDAVLQRRGYRDAITYVALRPEVDRRGLVSSAPAIPAVMFSRWPHTTAASNASSRKFLPSAA